VLLVLIPLRVLLTVQPEPVTPVLQVVPVVPVVQRELTRHLLEAAELEADLRSSPSWLTWTLPPGRC
jgi:hypothetical protein